MTDFVISDDLIVLGSSSFAGGQTFDGQVIIDVDDAEGLLIRKDGDGGDVFTVDTVNGIVTIGPTPVDYVKFFVAGSLTSGGGSNLASGGLFASDITSFSGDTALSQVRMGGVNVGGSITTSGAGDSVFAATLWLDEPDITLTPSDAMAIAATLFISGEPTEGTSNNYGIFNAAKLRQDGTADFFGNITQPGASANFTLGSGVPQTHARMAFLAAFVSTGISNHAEMLSLGGSVTGFNADTVSLAGMLADVSITTQGATQVITDVAQVIIQEPNITIGSGDTVTNASTLALIGSPTEGTNNFAIRSTGGAGSIFAGQSFIIGTATFTANNQVEITGAYTSTGGTTAAKLKLAGGFTGSAGVTSTLNGAFFDTSVATQTAAESISDVGQVRIDDPTIIDNLTGGGTILSAYTLFLGGSPTEGVNNFALRSVGPAPSIFGGVQLVIGSISVTGVLDRWGVLFTGSFTSGGSSNESAKFRIEGALTGADGDTAGMVGAYFDSTFVTQTAVENVANISQVRIDPPGNTDNLTGDIENVQSLFLSSSTTGGLANWTLRSTGVAPTIFQGVQFVIGRNTLEDWHQFVLAGAFTSGGSASEADKFKIQDSLTGAPGDGALNGAFFAAQIITQTATESIADIAQVKIFEPTITDNLTGSITRAQTLLLNGSPTEGLTNFALRSTGAARTMFVGLPFTIGTNIATDVWQVQIRGNFTSGGTSNRAAKFEIEESVIGVSGDTTFLGGALFAARITTQTAAEVVTDVFQVRLEEPIITVGAGSSITNAQTLLIVAAPTEGVNNYALRVASGDVLLGGNLAVSGAGPHAIGGIPSGIIGLIISDTFTSDGAATLASGVYITQTLVGASGDTTSLTGTTFISGITTQTETESIANISQVEMNEPFITDNLTGDITNAQTLLITGAPTEGLANYAVRVIAGSTFLGGELEHAGSTLGFFGTSPTTQPAAYTRNATIVEDRTLLASASATILNNNNVLAALIADLQSLGVIQ